MNAYNRQNILASLTSGFQSCSSRYLPTDGQHQANSKIYFSWADVEYAIKNDNPVSTVVLGTANYWQCYVVVHMFGVTYSRAVSINLLDEPLIDNVGFVYHAVTLEDEKREYDATKPVMSFALMLQIRDKAGDFAFVFWTRTGDASVWTGGGAFCTDYANTQHNL
jgi:hypothetical protein